MTMCSDLSEMCADRSVSLSRDREVAVTIAFLPSPDGDQWLVGDWGERRERTTVTTSREAAWRAYELLGEDARRVIGPAVAAWRYRRMFPIGSSLEWAAASSASFSSSASRSSSSLDVSPITGSTACCMGHSCTNSSSA